MLELSPFDPFLLTSTKFDNQEKWHLSACLYMSNIIVKDFLLKYFTGIC